MKRVTVIAATLLLVASATLLVGAQQLDETEVKPNAKGFMAAKLEHTKDIVEGLSLEDYSQIEAASQKLILLSHETNWQTFQTEQYLDLSEEFRGSAGRLKQAGKDRNLDGATLAYFEVTLNCVRCHKYVRNTHRNKTD